VCESHLSGPLTDQGIVPIAALGPAMDSGVRCNVAANRLTRLVSRPVSNSRSEDGFGRSAGFQIPQ
jgi:hypothetical protein